MLHLTYIWHDCFLLETESFNMVFDFWKDPDTGQKDIPCFLKNQKKKKPLYVVISHHHKDHFNRNVFGWVSEFENICYIISKDVFRASRYVFKTDSIYNGKRLRDDQYAVLNPGETFNDGIVEVKAFGSTDIGNSYLVLFGNNSVFHAGDLNAWVWKDESSEDEVAEALRDYKNILEDIAVTVKKIDMAMFPVDSRLGRDYWEGASIFVRTFNVGHFFPMHFGLADNNSELQKRERDASAFQLYANRERGEYIALQKPYSSYFIGKIT